MNLPNRRFAWDREITELTFCLISWTYGIDVLLEIMNLPNLRSAWDHELIELTFCLRSWTYRIDMQLEIMNLQNWHAAWDHELTKLTFCLRSWTYRIDVLFEIMNLPNGRLCLRSWTYRIDVLLEIMNLPNCRSAWDHDAWSPDHDCCWSSPSWGRWSCSALDHSTEHDPLLLHLLTVCLRLLRWNINIVLICLHVKISENNMLQNEWQKLEGFEKLVFIKIK